MTAKQAIAAASVLAGVIGLTSMALAQSGTRSVPTPPRGSGSPSAQPQPGPALDYFVNEAINQSISPSSRAQQAPGSGSRSGPPIEERLATFLQQAQYRNWSPLPGVSGNAYDGTNPHGNKVKLYANRLAATATGPLPVGSILVTENLDAKGTTLLSLTVMYRAEGFNPAAGDWLWTKYEADGSVSTLNRTRVTGKVASCIDCHRSAGGGDFVFGNDR